MRGLFFAMILLSVTEIHAQEYPFEKLHTQRLPNAIRVHPKVISGGIPADQLAFQELKELGVETIISVDGAVPNVELARQFGMRYVHLPHGYDGIPAERVTELAKALREFEGTIYIHCHHGQHRSPAAAAVACVAVGFIDAARGVALLQLAGTNPNYRGLFRAAERAQRIPTVELDRLKAQFKERADVPALATSMIAMEHTYDNLRKLSAAGWRKVSIHPDLDAAHEILLLREQFTEQLRTADTAHRDEAYRQRLRDGQQLAIELEGSLTTADSLSAQQIAALSTLMTRLADNCRACHAQYRDVPLE